MKTLKFKTTIKCSGCVATVTPKLNAIKEASHWEVDLNSADKILSVEGENISAEEIEQAVEEAGYKAEEL